MHTRNHNLIDEKIKQYLLPAIMMKLALQLGNIVDTILVGNLLGTDAMSAVSLAIPVLSFVQIPGYFLGNGGAIFAGIMLGKRKKQEASEIFTMTLIFTILCNTLFLVLSFFVTNPLAHLLSGGGALEHDVASYIFVCLAGSPALGVGLLLSSYFANDSHPQLASAYFIISNAVNLILDFVFLKFTPLGVTGAALSTMIGFAVGFVVLIFYVRSPKRMLRLTKPKFSKELAKQVTVTGLPFLSYLVVTMIKTFLMNMIVLSLLGESGMAVYTVCNNTTLILSMVTGGVVSVIPNFAGILYGEKDYYGIRALCKKILTYGYLLTAILFVLIMLFARYVALLFGVDDVSLQDTVVRVLRVYVFSMPFYLFNFFGMQYFGSVEKSALATVFTTLENGVFLIPAALLGIIAGQRLGGDGFSGLALAFVLSELLTALTALLVMKLKYKKNLILLIPKENTGVCLDLSLRADRAELPAVPREIISFCEKHGIARDKANLIAVAAEEMVANTISFGGDKSRWIDLCLSYENDGKLMLRLRDNGVPFDPTTYEYDEDEGEFEVHGIQTVKAVSTSVSYMRAMDLNNTIIEV